jgi:hypothetical protein
MKNLYRYFFFYLAFQSNVFAADILITSQITAQQNFNDDNQTLHISGPSAHSGITEG